MKIRIKNNDILEEVGRGGGGGRFVQDDAIMARRSRKGKGERRTGIVYILWNRQEQSACLMEKISATKLERLHNLYLSKVRVKTMITDSPQLFH